MLIEKVKTQRIDAMKNKDNIAKTILSTLYGELQSKAKRDGSEITDEMVIGACKKIIESNKETISIINGSSPTKLEQLLAESEVLLQFIPLQMTDEQLRRAIKNSGASNIGQAMAYLKKNHSGQYDGKLASTIAKQVF